MPTTGGKAIQRQRRLRSIEKAKVPMDLVVDREKEPQFARSRKKPLGFLRESVKTKMRGPPLKLCRCMLYTLYKNLTCYLLFCPV